jgi:hypothetical protein
VSYPTVKGQAVEGVVFREAQSNLTPTFASAYYQFYLSGTTTPANVYQNGNLTNPFPTTGKVTADAYGRFPAIWLDPSVIYRVRLYNSSNVQQWQNDPYYSQLSTVGTSSLSAYGLNIATTGEVTIPAPNTGGTGISLTLYAGAIGTSALELNGTLAGNSALIVNTSATTGAQTATFSATNKPGTSASAPAGWLPITCDGVQYYAPMWFDNSNFTPYTPNPSANGEVISASTATFGGNGVTTATGGTAIPGNWFSPTSTGIGAGYYINITKTGGLSGLAFSAAQGAWTNIGAGGLSISSNAAAPVTGTYRISTSVSGSPVVANGAITLSGNNGVQSPTYSGAANLALAGNGTATLNGIAASNWFTPTTANVGAGYYFLITPNGGTTGYSFSAATGTPANITNGGLSVGISGSGATSVPNVTGTYTISSDSAGSNVLGSGSITLTGSVTRTYTGTSGSDTAPPGSSFVTVELQSGGGGGYSTTGGSGYGGSGGGQAITGPIPISPGQTLAYALSGGSLQTNNNATGQNGGGGTVSSGTKSIGTMTVTGGGGGAASSAGAVGTASGGTYQNASGQPGLSNGTGGTGGDGAAGGAVGNAGSTPCAGIGRNNPSSLASGAATVVFIYN